MKIVFLDAKTLGDDLSLEPLSTLGELVVYETTSPQECAMRIADATVVITNKVLISEALMQQAPDLQLICVSATGTNNVDLDAAKSMGIEVKNVAGYSTQSVVQHTFAMLFYLLEQSAYYDTYAKTIWASSGLFTHVARPFYEIAGKRWGIIGLGTIGKEVAKIASSFGCEVVYYSTSGQNSCGEYTALDLKTLLQTSQIISIHAPLNDRTHHLLHKENLAYLQENSVLLNLGRGGIVDEAALAELIDRQTIYAGLDVLPKEPVDTDHPLLGVKNMHRLHLTPHIAWTSKEARQKLLEGVIDNIQAFIHERALS